MCIRDRISGFHNNPTDGVASVRKIKRIAAESGADVFFSHDIDEWNSYRHAPEFYE